MCTSVIKRLRLHISEDAGEGFPQVLHGVLCVLGEGGAEGALPREAAAAAGGARGRRAGRRAAGRAGRCGR